jgi:hypothetical protein
MIRQISLILGIGAFLTIGANTVQAELFNKQNRSSSASLDTLETRNNQKDSAVFFPELSQEQPPYQGTIGELDSRYDAEFNAFGEEFKLDVGEFLRDSDPYVDPSVGPGDAADNEKVRVLIDLDE